MYNKSKFNTTDNIKTVLLTGSNQIQLKSTKETKDIS